MSAIRVIGSACNNVFRGRKTEVGRPTEFNRLGQFLNVLQNCDILHEATKPAGVFTAADAAKHGISRSLLRRYVRNGTLLRNIFDRGVYRFGTPGEHDSIVDAALVAGREAVASRVTALRLHNVTYLLPEADEFTLPRSRRSRRPPAPIKFHFSSAPLPNAEITYVLGVRVTTPARALVDVARTTGRLDQIERGIAEAIESRLATQIECLAAVERSNLTRDGFSAQSKTRSRASFHDNPVC